MLAFKKGYLIVAIIIFIIEALIALYVKDKIIRPYIGDFLVVILIYCSIRSFLNFSIINTALGTLVFAYLVEFLQFLNLIEVLGLENSRLANIIIGNFFEWIDIIAYTAGIGSVLLFEKFFLKKSLSHIA